MTPGALAARLIVDFCLPGIIGKEKGRPPVEGQNVVDEMRLKLGLKPGGRTVRYPLAEAPVYLDVQGAESQVFFRHDDARAAYDAVNVAVKQAFPDLSLDDVALAPPLRKRALLCRLDADNVAILEIIDPAPEAPADVRDFAARVIALKRADPPLSPS
ncbi:MAG: hypothetical protein HXY28_00905 [Hydrogenophilaceae bacterium]|jgi:hypothetical protein|nr:hypothetical protein [Hydrogenophilaceae bacterium]